MGWRSACGQCRVNFTYSLTSFSAKTIQSTLPTNLATSSANGVIISWDMRNACTCSLAHPTLKERQRSAVRQHGLEVGRGHDALP